MHRFWAVPPLLLVVALCVSARAPARNAVSISGMKFNPATIDVAVGDTVRWTNDDDRDHTVTAADGSFDSGNLRRGGKFEHKFGKPGKFKYACSYHPRMKGSVNVSE